MRRDNSTIVVNVKPKEYLQQGMRHCGGYTVKAILSAYNLDDGRHPRGYILPLIKRLRDFGLVSPEMVSKELEKYIYSAPIKQANKLSDGGKINQIKKEINKNHPVILLIGNGYSPQGKYSWLQQQFVRHWISVWGYDDKQNVFFIYDSFVDKQNYDKVPIGNVKRTYKQVLRDWKGVFYLRFRNFLYIPVISKKDIKKEK